MADPIAVCGLGLRVPGKHLIDTPDKFWEFLLSGEDASSAVPHWKWDPAAYFDRQRNRKLKTRVVRGNYVHGDALSEVDCGFFNLSASQARAMDPQHRMALQCAVEALWDACIDPAEYAGRLVDVVVGQATSEHVDLLKEDWLADLGAIMMGNCRTMGANRISFFFDFKGRSYSVDSACSSSLQAVELAVQSLQAYQCELAVVVGVNFLCDPRAYIAFQSLGVISSDGRSKFCDAGANGYGRGEAVVALVLQRVEDAVKENRTVYCKIRGALSSHDGNKEFIAFPSGDAQASLVKRVYANHGLSPADTQYVEAHGTGTDAGDRTEMGSICSAMVDGVQGRVPGEKLLVGSVKSNCGHTEGAAGALGVAKVALMLYHGMIPPSLHLNKLHPSIQLEGNSMDVPQKLCRWPATRLGLPKRAAVNSFGIGGTNAHVVLEEFNRSAPANSTVEQLAQAPYILPLSGHSKKALVQNIAVWIEFLQEKRREYEENPEILLKKVHHAIYGRSHMNWRVCAVGESAEGLRAALKKCLESQEASGKTSESTDQPVHHEEVGLIHKEDGSAQEAGADVHAISENSAKSGKDNGEIIDAKVETAEHTDPSNEVTKYSFSISSDSTASKRQSLLFVFSGQGTQYLGMGLQLYESEHVFKGVLDKCNRIIQDEGESLCLIEELRKSEEDSMLKSPNISLVLLPAIQIALVELLRSKGIKASGSLGHSSGEVAAAYCSGSIYMKTAVLVALARSRAVEKFGVSQSGFGPKMMAIGMGLEEAEEMLKEMDIDEEENGKVVVGAINSALSVTLSGDESAINLVKSLCKERSIPVKDLKVGAAFHSHHMSKAAEELAQQLSCIEPQESLSPMFSTVTGGCVNGARLDATYWRDNLAKPVLFSDALMWAFKQGDAFDGILEIGPQSVLSSPIRQVLSDLPTQQQRTTPIFCPMNMDSSSREDVELKRMLCKLYCHGFPINWRNVFFWPSGTNEPTSDLPAYPFQTRHIIRLGIPAKAKLFPKHPIHNLLGKRARSKAVSFKNYLDVNTDFIIRDHVIQGNQVLPGVSYFEIALAAIQVVDKEQRGAAQNVLSAAGSQNDALQEKSYFVLRDAKFHQPLVLDDQYAFVETSVDPVTNMITVNSRAAKLKDIDLMNEMDDPRLHFTCTFAKYPLTPDVYNDFYQEHAAVIEKSKTFCTVDLLHDVMYSKLRRLGLEFGPYMQRARNVKYGYDDKGTRVASGNVHWPDSEQYRYTHPYYLAPVVLDSALHFTVAATMEKSTQFHIPTKCEEFVYIPPETSMEQEMAKAREWMDKDVVAEIKRLQIEDMSSEQEAGENRYHVSVRVPDTGIDGFGNSHVYISQYGKPLVFMRGFKSVRLGDPKPDEIVPIEESMFKTVWSSIVEDESDKEAPDMVVQAENRCLIVISPQPQQHPWVAAISASEDIMKGFEEVYPGGVWIGDSVADAFSIYETASSKADLMYVSEESGIEPIDMVHGLHEIQNWLSVVSPKTGIVRRGSGFNLYLLTFGANVEACASGGSCLLGLGRTVASEYVDIKTHLVDLEKQDAGSSIDSCKQFLATILMDPHVRCHLELALRSGKVLVPKLVRIDVCDENENEQYEDAAKKERAASSGQLDSLGTKQVGDKGQPSNYCLRQAQKGNLDSLAWHEDDMPELGNEKNLVVEVNYVGINFKDTLLLLGVLDQDAFADGGSKAVIGLECAGIVKELGSEAPEGFAVGDRIAALPIPGQSAFQKYVEVDGRLAVKVPTEMSLETASGLLVAGLTAHFSIEDWGEVAPGEVVLIHSAAGAVGILCVQMALKKGAIVIATASPPKHGLLKKAGAHYIFNSRTLDFVDEVKRVTDGRGVDVVINSLYGAATRESISLLAPMGRFVEIGKRDIMEGSTVLMKAFLRNCSYRVFDLDSLFISSKKGKFSKAGKLLNTAGRNFIMDFLNDGIQLPVTIYPAARIIEAFKLMSGGKHVGKIVTSLPSLNPLSLEPAGDADEDTAAPSSHQIHVKRDQLKDMEHVLSKDDTYVFVGGTSGLTLTIAFFAFLYIKGCKHVILLSKSGGVNSSRLDAVLRQIRCEIPGANVDAFAVDVSDEEQLEQFLVKLRSGRIGGFPSKIGGIIHSAMVLRDKPLLEITSEDLEQVMAPKAKGAYLLHKLTLQDDLQFFILFSSVSTVVGNISQGSYSAANCYLEGLAKYRRARGLPARCIQLGPISDSGVVGRSAGLTALSSSSTVSVQLTTPEQVFTALITILCSDALKKNVPFCHTTRRKVPILLPREKDASVEVDESDAVVLVAALNLNYIAGMFPAHARSAKLRDLIAEAQRKQQLSLENDMASNQVGTKILQLIANDEGATAVKEVSNATRHRLALVSGGDPSELDATVPFMSFGLNSLQLVQFKAWADGAFGISVPFMIFGKDTSIDSLAHFIVDHLRAVKAQEREEEDHTHADSYLPESTDDVPGQQQQRTVQLLKHGVSSQRIIGDVVSPTQNPKQIIFLFPGFPQEGPVLQTLGDRAVASGHLTGSKLVLVRLDYASGLHGSKSWTSYLEGVATCVKQYMESTWALHRDDASSLPFQLLGHSLGAYVILEVNTLLIKQGLQPSQLVAMNVAVLDMYKRTLSSDSLENDELLLEYMRSSPQVQDDTETGKCSRNVPLCVVHSRKDGLGVPDLMASWGGERTGRVSFFESTQNQADSIQNPDNCTVRALVDAISGDDTLHECISRELPEALSAEVVGAWAAGMKLCALAYNTSGDVSLDFQARKIIDKWFASTFDGGERLRKCALEDSRRLLTAQAQLDISIGRFLHANFLSHCTVVQLTAFETPTAYWRCAASIPSCNVQWVDIICERYLFDKDLQLHTNHKQAPYQNAENAVSSLHKGTQAVLICFTDLLVHTKSWEAKGKELMDFIIHSLRLRPSRVHVLKAHGVNGGKLIAHAEYLGAKIWK